MDPPRRRTAPDGGLDKEVIRRVIGGFRYCDEAQLNRSPNLVGKVSVRFLIELSGRVALATTRSSANSAQLKQCLQSRFLLLRFPARTQGNPVWVTYPLLFHLAGS